jgi:hypothetical protein
MPKFSFSHSFSNTQSLGTSARKRGLLKYATRGHTLPHYTTTSNNKLYWNMLNGFRDESRTDGRTRPSVIISTTRAAMQCSSYGKSMFTFREPSWMLEQADSSERSVHIYRTTHQETVIFMTKTVKVSNLSRPSLYVIQI